MGCIWLLGRHPTHRHYQPSRQLPSFHAQQQSIRPTTCHRSTICSTQSLYRILKDLSLVPSQPHSSTCYWNTPPAPRLRLHNPHSNCDTDNHSLLYLVHHNLFRLLRCFLSQFLVSLSPFPHQHLLTLSLLIATTTIAKAGTTSQAELVPSPTRICL